MQHSSHAPQDPKDNNRRRVLEEILRTPGVARTEVANRVGLNIASVSRITRELIEARLISETDAFGPSDKPGRRFVGLVPQGDGGFVIGIGINAFRQSVTLADLSNRKVAEWVSPEAPGPDGASFIHLCLQKAAEMIDAQGIDRRRFFGVGMAVAAEIDASEGMILSAPVLGWTSPIHVAEQVREVLGSSFVLATPPVAINSTEADVGVGQGAEVAATLHCSLGFGLGLRRGSEDGPARDFGRVLTESIVPVDGGIRLSDACGGRAVLLDYYGADRVTQAPDHTLGPMLVDLIGRSKNDEALARNFHDKGLKAARCLSLVLDFCQPERLLLAGPMVASEDFVHGFQSAIGDVLNLPGRSLDIQVSDMTPARACRWLALKGSLPTAIQKLNTLRMEIAA